MSRHYEPNSNHILTSALKWVLAERLFLRLAIDVSEHSLDDELRAAYPKLFDIEEPLVAEFLLAYEVCLEFHMGGYVLRAEEFHRKVVHAQECYARAQAHAGISSVGNASD